MVFDITSLQKIRKQLGLTQHAFAARAGISQSMVAKIESGKLDPAYSKVQKIEQVLATLTHHEEKKAAELMTRNVVSVHSSEHARKVIEVMQKRGISQVPVIRGEKVLGMVYESSFLRHDVEKFPSLRVEEVMEEAPPFVSVNAPLSVIRGMLQWYACVLVVEKGKLAGIITRADILKNLQKP